MNFKRTYLFTLYIVLFACLLSGGVLFNGCKSNNSSTYVLTGNILEDGKNLVQINCTKCHALVPVDALNKNVWKHHTLPSMCKYFQVSAYLDGYYKDEKDTAGLSLVAWETIVAYYDKLAPDTILSAKKPTPLINDWAEFTLKTPPPVVNNFYRTTLASFDPNNHNIYTADGETDNFTEWDSNLKMRKVTKLPSPVVSAVFTKDATGKNEAVLSCIGELDRVDFPNGRVLEVSLDGKKDTVPPGLIASELNRPVQVLEGDFNNDGLKDLIVLGQGRLKGGVYLFKQNPDHSYTQTTLSDKYGAVQAVAGDFNNDGWQDLMVLFGSGDEGLWLFLNDHKGGFTAKNLLQFPPVYGSSSFQLVDIDHDGKPDLIYTCGYNYHDSRILKPYHGLYIYKNMGDWNFKQKWFYPIDGCTKAIAADFKGNGTLDIATSAFFADMKTDPAESFVYFEQVSPFNYKPHAIPISKYGRWMTMEVADYNGDGKPDIILGNYSTGYMFQLGLKPFWSKDIPFVILENNFKK
jgi:hypothetical protein